METPFKFKPMCVFKKFKRKKVIFQNVMFQLSKTIVRVPTNESESNNDELLTNLSFDLGSTAHQQPSSMSSNIQPSSTSTSTKQHQSESNNAIELTPKDLKEIQQHIYQTILPQAITKLAPSESDVEGEVHLTHLFEPCLFSLFNEVKNFLMIDKDLNAIQSQTKVIQVPNWITQLPPLPISFDFEKHMKDTPVYHFIFEKKCSH